MKLYTGDCKEVMKEMPENSIDSIVTDPPYGLKFMGKHWDYDVPGVDVWKECLRVLKPGGYLLSFGGTRTYHRMVVNIEDAGFELRDMVSFLYDTNETARLLIESLTPEQLKLLDETFGRDSMINWVYGSGFPKSLNIGKQVDKVMGNERMIVGNGKPMKNLGVIHDDNWVSDINYKETKGTSEFEGWGTALKPAHEPIVVGRKPIREKTIAENVLKWGTGGLNIDGCRVQMKQCDAEKSRGNWKPNGYDLKESIYEYGSKTIATEQNIQGRFPANVIHDGSDVVVRLFPEEAGAFAPVKSGQKGFGGEIYGKYKQSGDDGDTFYNDMGSAARFFYCAKADKDERNCGLDEFDKQFYTSRPWCDKETYSDDMERIAARLVSKTGKNFHPTVKPISLMRYLCRLVTPKKGIILDPFMGSGSTGCGAVIEGFDFRGIETEEEYKKIAEARIGYCNLKMPEQQNTEKIKGIFQLRMF